MSDDISEPDAAPSEQFSVRNLLLGQLPLETETAFFILVNVLDYFLTIWLLIWGGFRESNPIAHFFLAHWGPVKGMLLYKLGLVVFVCLIAQIVARKNRRTAERLLWFGTLAVGTVVFYSATLILRKTMHG